MCNEVLYILSMKAFLSIVFIIVQQMTEFRWSLYTWHTHVTCKTLIVL